MPYQHLTSTSRLDYSFDTVEGLQPVFLRSLIEQNLESVYEGASRVLSEAVEKTGTNIIDWHTKVQGEVREYNFLKPSEKNMVNRELALSAQLFDQTAQRLRESKSEQKRLASKIFDKIALSFANFIQNPVPPLQVFLVGNTPVVAGWGLVSIQSSDQIDGELSDIAYKNANYIIKNGTVPENLYIQEYPSPPAEQVYQSAPYEVVPIAAAAEGGCFWNLLRTLLTAFLTLLILSLLLFLLLPNRWLLFKEPPYYDPSLERDLELELYSYKSDYLNKWEGCPVEEAQLRPEPLPKPPVEDLDTRETESVPDFYSVNEPEPVPEPKPDPKEGAAMDIPEDDPNDISFLEGCWKSDAGIIIAGSDRPLYDIYCFDKNGNGTLTTELYNKSGKLEDTCTTTTTATRNGNQVIIVDEGAKCPKEGFNFSKYQMTCSKATGNRTNCNVRERNYTSDSRKPFDNKFTYLGKSK